ncbi:hypothetical protein Fot_24800 [Forsythia ovata]|uniref:Uncharacterized protein n=1 Tax=Forsythia ovata TaxID=205694 RepID=A0ABD1U7E0_9LAMI
MAKALAYAQRKGLMERIAQLEEANAQRDRLMDKIAQLEETGETLRAECYDLNGENPSLKSGTDEVVKAEVLTNVKDLYHKLDLSAIEVDYPAPEEAKDGTDLPPNDGADHPPVDGA